MLKRLVGILGAVVIVALAFTAEVSKTAGVSLVPQAYAQDGSASGGFKGGGGGGGNSNSNSGSGKKSGAGKSVAIGQLIANACATIVIAGKSLALDAASYPRQLTPIEAYDTATRCGSYVGIIASLSARALGYRDSACNYDVAHRARNAENTPLAREQLLWSRDGSDSAWRSRQTGFMAEHLDCYRGVQKKPKKKKRPRKTPLTS